MKETDWVERPRFGPNLRFVGPEVSTPVLSPTQRRPRKHYP